MPLPVVRAFLACFPFLPFALLAQTTATAPPPITTPPARSEHLTLEQAEAAALKNHPSLASAALSAEAQNKVVAEARSAYLPTASVNVTGAVANDATVLAAGNVTTSSLSTRFATGVGITQLITDFGRTTNLVNAAKLRYQAANDSAINVRAQIILRVRSAYFAVLGSETVLRAAAATLNNRQLTLRQITALQQSSLRSSLDVTFAQVLVSEAQLAVNQAENNAASSRAALAAAMGTETVQQYTLEDQTAPGPLNPDLASLVNDALQDRPDLNLLKHNRDAAYQFAKAESKLSAPTVDFLAAAGAIPARDHLLAKDNYEGAAINIHIPVFNGGLFAARRAEAQLKAQAADKDVQTLSVVVARDVRTAWFNANNAYRKLGVTTQLVNQSRLAVHLAQARYNSGLGSIVELNEAQTSEISAEIAAAGAKYDYLISRTALDFSIGALR